MKKVLQQGAEAIIYLDKDKVIKDRIKKSYRISELDDKIRKQRTKSETKLLEKASNIINSVTPLKTNEKFSIEMPFIEGKKLSEHLDNFEFGEQKKICRKIGESVAKLHNNNIIHSDLTTSNMILKKDKIFFIDFGLGFISQKIEDKAVDIHLFKEALEAKHFGHWQDLFKEFLNGYSAYPEHKKILEQVKKVESRGRYRH
ncbi:Kae1-associated kinase Bud32 [Candidatus Pacearchaeota archaeon RBG_16_35_8]|nr:MAG: Kae1-associated kinase Bud32 [Candidatus Pacearchaeota archaeon RBG_16_35_8]